MSITEIKGDLFSVDEKTSLCHCVSADFAMGAGIAVEFKKRFGPIKPRDELCAGTSYPLRAGDRTVFYLVTKTNYWEKPTYGNLHESLVAMKAQLDYLSIKKVAMPRIGCGLDRLEWDKVKKLIEKLLPGIEVLVYVL